MAQLPASGIPNINVEHFFITDVRVFKKSLVALKAISG
jgi:hypothetical protein